MLGYFDASDGNPKITLEISGTNNKTKQIVALFDTGHSGSLSLPVIDLIEIGARLSNVGEVILADGFKKTVLYFSVKVKIDGKEKDVEASMIENYNSDEAIVGLELFAPYAALIDFNKKILKFIESHE